MPPVALHYNPNIFPDPWTFNPDRFANGEPQYGYFPFGGGYENNSYILFLVDLIFSN